MTWPTTPISTSNLDQGTDSPALARSQIKSAVDNVNSIAAEFGNVDLAAPATDDVLAWDGAKWVAQDPNSLTDIVLVGDVTATGTLSSNVTATLSNTAVTAGTYGSATEVAQITVDSKGRVTSAANVTITGGGSGGGATAVFNLNRTNFTPGGSFTNIGSNFTQLYNGTTITYSAGVFSVPAGTWLLEFDGVFGTISISGGSNPIDNTDFRLQNTTAATTLISATTIPTGNDVNLNYGHFTVCKPFTTAVTSNVEFQFISNESATIEAQNVGIKFTQLA